jgi:hypothetical protein
MAPVPERAQRFETLSCQVRGLPELGLVAVLDPKPKDAMP